MAAVYVIGANFLALEAFQLEPDPIPLRPHPEGGPCYSHAEFLSLQPFRAYGFWLSLAFRQEGPLLVHAPDVSCSTAKNQHERLHCFQLSVIHRAPPT